MTFPRRFAFAALFLVCISLTRVPLAHAQSDSTAAPATLTFTTIDVPGAMITSVQGSNIAGDMVGYYSSSNSGPYQAFLLRSGSFTFFDYQGQSTVATGINDSGLIVGYAGTSRVRGFLYNGTTFTSIRDGSDSATFGMGINNAGLVVGGAGTIFTTKGFELRGGHFKAISPTGSYVYVYATGINNLGEVVGWADSTSFAYNHGKFQTVAFPGATQTEAWDVNDSSVTVGWYSLGSSVIYGFALANGQYTSFSYPGAMGTFPRGINASGEIVGEYTLDYQTYHGFVTSPFAAGNLQ